MRRFAIVLAFAAGGALSLEGSVSAAQTGAWAPGATYPEARSQMLAIGGPDGLVYIFGGFDGADAFSDVYALDPIAQTYAPRAPMPVATRGACGALVDEDTIVIVGGFEGFGGNNNQVNATQVYTISTNTWVQGTDRTSGWECAAAADDQGRLHLFGGEGNLIGHARYEYTTDTWTPLPGMPTARQGHGAFFAPDGRFVVFGGGDDAPSNTTQIFDPTTGLWSDGPNMPGQAIHFGYTSNPLAAFVIGGSTVNGNDQAPFFDTVWVYDGEDNAWSTAAFPLAAGVRENNGAYLDGQLWTLGGSDGALTDIVQTTFVDSDDDGLFDIGDNCPFLINPGQENADGDAFGNVCDTCPLDPLNDIDGDNHCGDVDNCAFVPNPGQEDVDDDGVGDACDNDPGTTSMTTTDGTSDGSTSDGLTTGATSGSTSGDPSGTGTSTSRGTTTSMPTTTGNDDSTTSGGSDTDTTGGSTDLPPFTTAADTDTAGGTSGDDGCGCRSTPQSTPGWLVLVLPMLRRRRRRA